MADATLSDAVKRLKAADALTDDSDDTDQESTEEYTDTQEDTGTPAQTKEGEQPADQAEPTEPVTEATATEAAPRLGYTFVPIGGGGEPAPPAAAAGGPDTSANVPRGSQFFLNPATGSYEQKLYTGSEEEGGGRYVIDQDTGQMIPHAELATPADKAAQPPGGIELPKVEVAGQAAGAPAPVPGQNYIFKPLSEPQAVSAPTVPAVQKAQPVQVPQVAGIKPLTADQAREPDIDIQSNGFTPGRGNQPIRNVILHSTDGTEKSDINTLTQSGKVGVQYYVTKDGRVMHFVNDSDSAWQAGLTKYGDNGNPYTIGIEQEHIDGKEPWPDAQVRATAKTAAAILMRNPQLTLDDVIGHSDLAGERKQDPVNYPWDKFHTYVQAYMGQGGAQVAQGAPQAQPATKQANGLYQNEKPGDFLTGKATTFATPSDIASGEDNGVGAPHLGRLDTTSVAGVAIPEEALRAKYGNNYAAWRTARVDVVDPQTGKRLRVPIVDLGPRGDFSAITDMTPTLSNYFGGDKNLMVRLVDRAGPDVTKNPQLFADEQAAIKQGVDSSALQPGVAKVQPRLGYSFKPVDPVQSTALAQADAFNQQNQRQALSDLNDQAASPVALYKRLDQPVDGVSDPMRKEFQGELKSEITKYAQDFYGEKDPDAAFTKATSDANFGTVAGEALRKIPAMYGQLDVALNQASQSSDANALDRFARVIHPEATPEGRAAFIKTLTDIQDPAVRSQTIGKLWAELEPQKQASVDINGLVGAADNVASPEYQKAQQTAIDTKKAWIQKQLRADPRLQGTLGDFIADQGAQLLPNVTLALLPPGIRESAFAAQIYSQAKDEFKHDHPDWTDTQLNDAASKSAFLQLAPQEVVSAAIGGKLGALTGGIENRAARIGATALSHVGIGTGGAVWQQVAANLAAGKPAYEGIGQAALAGVIQTLPGGLAAGVLHPAPERALAERTEVPPIAPPPREEPPAPVTSAHILGPDVSDVSVPWYKPGPIVTRAQERTAFTPAQLNEAVQRARESGSPEQIRQAMENLQPPPDFTQQTVHLADQPIPEPAVPVTREDVARRTYEIGEERAKNGQPGTALDDWTQAQQELSQATEPTPVTQGEAEPWVSAIANRFTAERAARGQLGDVIPGEGYSKEELRAAGLQMGPEEINQHVSDLMHNTGDPKLQAAAITAEEARLSQRSNAASRASELNPADADLRMGADNAFKDLTDFHNGPVAKLKNNWHAQGMTLQGEVPVDLSTFNGLRENFLRETGQAPSANMEPVLRKTAKAVADAAMQEKVSRNQLIREIDRQSARARLPTDIEVRDAIMKQMGVEPCRT